MHRPLALMVLLTALPACDRQEGPPPGSTSAFPAAGMPEGDASAVPSRAPTAADPSAGRAAGDLATAPFVAIPAAGTAVGAKALSWTVPDGWVEERPASAMRRAQYRIPGPAGDAELVVFYFGPGQGGDPRANAERWAGQFEQPDGRPATEALLTARRKVGGIDVLTVEVAGTYSGGMPMNPGPKRPGWKLLGAVAEGPDANWFFKLTGPEATIEAKRAEFDAFLSSLKPGG